MDVTPEKVMAYQPVHFAESAERFGKTSAQWLDATQTQHAEALALLDQSWKGVAATAYRLVANADHAVVTSASGKAGAAADLASMDGELVWDAAVAAQAAISAAYSAGIKVTPGWQLVDGLPPLPTEAMRHARQVEIQGHAQVIGTAVSDLVVQDQRAAAAMRVAGDFSQYHQSPNGHINAVDYTVVNPDGSEKHVPTPAKSPTVIDQSDSLPVPDGGKHYCGPMEVLEDTAVGTAGAYGTAGGGGPGGIVAGIPALIKGVNDLSHCENPK